LINCLTFTTINTRKSSSFRITDAGELKKKMLRWANRFNIFCFLDNQDYSIEPARFECLLAAGASSSVSGGPLSGLDDFLEKSNDWKFGHLSYGLKDRFFKAASGDPHSSKPDPIGFPDFFFFIPGILLILRGNELQIEAPDPAAIHSAILDTELMEPEPVHIEVKGRLDRESYLEKIKSLREHIIRGDCYEINFCQEFFAEDVLVQPDRLYHDLVTISPNPFCAFYRLDDRYLICASPERFMTRKGPRIISQPMKGTIRRDRDDAAADARLLEELRASAKDRSENVMVVDLVRNDLTRICEPVSVRVDELFGVYSYPQVHQMISTISGVLRKDISFGAIIEALFPMGSMTGAPKQRVVELIDKYEPVARGIFSGSVGYIDPSGDFDFNVVIRSIMYEAKSRYLSYQVGSGITFYSDPELEWEECLLKAMAIKKVLTG
jgi:para-aminobenzoate synthetase component 1